MSYDPYWSYVRCLLHCDGIDNSNRLVDERHHTVDYPSGNPKITTLEKKFGAGALTFNGTGSAFCKIMGNVGVPLLTPVATIDFTFEAWLFPKESANSTPIPFGLTGPISSAGSLGLVVDGSAHAGKFAVFYGDFSASNYIMVSTTDVVYDQWVHIAFTRSGTTFRLFVNGVEEATTVFSGGNNAGSGFLNLGGHNTISGYAYNGLIDDLRYTYGVARYASNFSVPTAALEHGTPVYDADYDKTTFHCHFSGENNGDIFTDQKAHTLTRSATVVTAITQSKFGGSSLKAVAGSGTLSSAATNDLDLGEGDFTIEFWVFFTDTSGFRPILSVHPVGLAQRALGVVVGGGGNYLYYPTATSGQDASSGYSVSTFSVNNWHFVSLSRQGNNLYFHLNGTRISTLVVGTDTVFDSSPHILVFGSCGPYQGGNFNGYLDEFRFTKGVGRYGSATYTVPADPFPDFAVQKLTGTVRDPSGSPISRVVRSYRASDGLHVDTGISDPTTGAFQLRATDVSEHFVVVHDPVKNALIYDHITPVV